MPDISKLPLDPAEITLDLNVTGIANIPNQIHHEERHRKHRISIALIGDAGLGKTKFINSCMKQEILSRREQHSSSHGKTVKIRTRRAQLWEAGVQAELNLVDVPSCGLLFDRQTCYSAIEAYAKDQIKEYMELSRQIERPAQIVDKRIDLALFFINGLTSRQLSMVELESIREMSRLTNVILVIGKSDTMLPSELNYLKSKITSQIMEANIALFMPDVYSACDLDLDKQTIKPKKAPRIPTLQDLLFPRFMPQILRSSE